MKEWECIYEKRGKYFLKPYEGIQKIAAILKTKKVKKVLDLGCGSGRHLVYFAKRGFDMYGIDSSATGIAIAKKWLKTAHLKAHFNVQDIYQKLPYKSKFFDAIISTQVLHHNYPDNVKNLIKEMERVLKDNGMLFFTVPKFRHKRQKERLPLKKVGYRTYLPMDGMEKGLLHFYFTKKILITYFNNFRILSIKLGKHDHYEVLAVKK